MSQNSLTEEYVRLYKDKSRISLIENYFTAYDGTVGKDVKFNLFPRQKVFLQTLANNHQVIAIKHRQAGITTISAAWIAGELAFSKNHVVLILANQKTMALDFLSKIYNYIDMLPRFLFGNEYWSPIKNDPKNLKSIYVKRNQSEFELVNGCKGYARSAKKDATRGISSVSILCIDEASYVLDGVEVFGAASAAQSAVADYHTIMISTPHGKDQLYYKTYVNALEKKNNFVPVEFKWYQDLRYNRFLEWHRKIEETGEEEIIKEKVLDKLGNIPYDEERWRKLEKEGWKPTSPWYVKMCKSFNNNEMLIAQELDASFLGSAGNVLPQSVLEAQKENVVQITDDWELRDELEPETWIWEDPIPGHRYIIAADVSSGSGEDETAIEVIDCDAIDENGLPCFTQVLEFVGQRSGDQTSDLLYKYGTAYNSALCIIDCLGGYGDAAVLGLIDRYPNLYREDPNLKDYTLGDTVNKRKVKAEDERLPGFRTNAVRTQMLDKLRERLTDNSFRVRSMRVINELDTWVWKNGRPDHMSGFHDDTLTCLAMALFIMEFYMFRKLKNVSKDAVMLRSWRSSKSFLTPEDINGAQPKGSLNIAEQKPKYKMPFYSSGAKERQIQKRTMAMLMLGGFKPKNL